ncbi:MAG TPA: YsnF/AvaK domain-containing protein [Stellaceae bacterium]|nr:YsnF/AvaK domain-containing protein [Stellaceae bacterium]
MAGYNLVAIYRSHADADRARERLIEAGIAPSHIRLSSGETATATPPAARPGMFDWLFGRDVPERDRAWYGSHLYGGRIAVSVWVATEELRERVTTILEEFNPLDESDLTGTAAAPLATEAAAARTTEAPVGVAPTLESERIERERPIAGAASETVTEGEQVIPVTKEELTIGKRAFERRYRIRTHVVETPVEEQVNLHDERVVIERRPATGEPAPGTLRDREFEVVEHHEEPVVGKRTRGVEEVVVRKENLDRTETVRDTVRETRVDVEDETAAERTDTTVPPKPL